MEWVLLALLGLACAVAALGGALWEIGVFAWALWTAARDEFKERPARLRP